MRYPTKTLLTVLVSFLVAACGGNLYGQGGLSLDFSTDPLELGVEFFGTSEWREDGGVDNTGYLKVTDANNGESGAIVFPDLSDPQGTALESFQITADLRVGAGTESPADGFSFNLVRPDDPLLGTGTGYAASPANEANLPEEGSTTGLAIGFDEWQSGPADPNATPEDCGDFVAFDCIGISVRVDNELVAQAPFPTLNGELDDQTSLQTGPRGDVEGLGWAQLVIQLTPAPGENMQNLFISYKDREVINEVIEYVPSPGFLVFGGRTGGANSNHHIDNIGIITDFTKIENLGDFNLDGAVDTADFMILAGNMNTRGIQLTLSDGDINFDKRIDLADFAAFRKEYLAANPGGAAAAAVPEPQSWLLALSGLIGCLLRRRKR